MAPKKKTVTGLQRIGCEWYTWGLPFDKLPADWSVREAAQNPGPWLSDTALLHALRRQAIQADQPSCRLLLSLRGQDFDKQRQLEAAVDNDAAAKQADDAVRAARASLTQAHDNTLYDFGLSTTSARAAS